MPDEHGARRVLIDHSGNRPLIGIRREVGEGRVIYVGDTVGRAQGGGQLLGVVTQQQRRQSPAQTVGQLTPGCQHRVGNLGYDAAQSFDDYPNMLTHGLLSYDSSLCSLSRATSASATWLASPSSIRARSAACGKYTRVTPAAPP